MEKNMYKTKKEIAEALNYYSFAGEKVQKAITEDDIYITKGWTFVNMSATKSRLGYSGIGIYDYPLNEYCEAYGDLFYISNKSFKDYVDTEVDFSGEYPREKNPPKIVMVESKITTRKMEKK